MSIKSTALITGATGGIGKEFTKIHAASGGDVIATGLRTENLQALKQEIEAEYGVTVHTVAVDLSESDAAERLYHFTKEHNLTVDYLINNAGFGGVGTFAERPWEQDSAMIQVNVVALAALTRLFLPDMIARNSGRILNVSSTASLVPGPGQAVYYATKAFVTSFSQGLYGETMDTDVTVTALLPGATKTGFGAHSGMDKTDLFKHTADPHDVARAGYEAMLAGKVQVIAGLTLSQKMTLLLPFIPKKVQIKMIWKQQQISSAKS